MSVTYTATLSVREETVLFLSRLLQKERQRRGTRPGTRALGCFRQAVLMFLAGVRFVVARGRGDWTVASSRIALAAAAARDRDNRLPVT